jgi:hypothetical protein
MTKVGNMSRLSAVILAVALLISGCGGLKAMPTQSVTGNITPIKPNTPTPVYSKIFVGGFETAIYQYPNAVNNWQAPQPSPPGDRLTRVNSPARCGNWSLRAMVKPGDNYGSSGERAEVYGMYGPDGKQIFENEASGSQFYAISVYLPLDFVAPYNSLHPNWGSAWGIFQQLHGNDVYHAPPPFAIGATDSYYVQIFSGDLDYLSDRTKSLTIKYPIGALQRGKWVDFVWKIKFAKTFTGSVDVWKRIEGETDFTNVLSVANIPTLQFASSVRDGAVLDAYWKTGYYTSQETFTRVIYIDCNTRGGNFNDVVASAFPMPSVTPLVTTSFTVTPTGTNTYSLTRQQHLRRLKY